MCYAILNLVLAQTSSMAYSNGQIGTAFNSFKSLTINVLSNFISPCAHWPASWAV